MPNRFNAFDPTDWISLSLQQQGLAMSAAETIVRRTILMGTGTMNGVEATSMMMEKPAAFARGFERAAVAAAKGRSPVQVTEEFWKPVAGSAGANAKRLRK